MNKNNRREAFELAIEASKAEPRSVEDLIKDALLIAAFIDGGESENPPEPPNFDDEENVEDIRKRK